MVKHGQSLLVTPSRCIDPSTLFSLMIRTGLQDQVDSVFDVHLGWVADVRTTLVKRGSWSYCCQSLQLRDFYCNRAALEREYATKLELLARKVTEKRLKAVAPLVVGSDTENTIKQKSVHVQLLDPPSVLK